MLLMSISALNLDSLTSHHHLYPPAPFPPSLPFTLSDICTISYVLHLSIIRSLFATAHSVRERSLWVKEFACTVTVQDPWLVCTGTYVTCVSPSVRPVSMCVFVCVRLNAHVSLLLRVSAGVSACLSDSFSACLLFYPCILIYVEVRTSVRFTLSMIPLAIQKKLKSFLPAAGPVSLSI